MKKVLVAALAAGIFSTGCGGGTAMDAIRADRAAAENEPNPLANATPEQDLYIALLQGDFGDQSHARQDVFCNRWKDDPAEIQRALRLEATHLNLYEEYRLSPEDAEEAVKLYLEWECVTRWER